MSRAPIIKFLDRYNIQDGLLRESALLVDKTWFLHEVEVSLTRREDEMEQLRRLRKMVENGEEICT